MILKKAYRSSHQGKLFLHLRLAKCSTAALKYGYVIDDDGHQIRDRDNKGALHRSKIDLPDNLKDSLQLFYKRYSRKQIISDGLKLSSHIVNRGRPTHATWQKYKEEVEAADRRAGKRGRDHNSVNKFALDEAIQEGLLSEEHLTEEILKGLSEKAVTKLNDENEINSEHSLDDVDDIDIADKKREKSKMKRPELKSYSMVRYGARETAAFTACQLPSVYGSTLKVLHEIKKREPLYEPKTILDFGSGTGMTVWAANEVWGNTIKEYQCVDASEHMNKAAEFLLRGSSDINTPAKIPYVYFKQFLPLSNQIKYDVVIAAYTLTEMPFQKQRLQAIQSLWRKTKDYLVIIEPGNNEGFETALQARRFIAGKDQQKEGEFDYSHFEDSFSSYELDDGSEDSGHIFAPCTHELVCARTDVKTRDHPCNFSQKVELSLAFNTIRSLKRNGYFNERFSYIILKKGAEEGVERQDVGWARILDPVKKRSRHVICELCCHNGNIEKHILTKKKDQDIYKAARHMLKWGDMLPFERSRRPQHIRPSPSCEKEN